MLYEELVFFIFEWRKKMTFFIILKGCQKFPQNQITSLHLIVDPTISRLNYIRRVEFLN